MQIALWEKIEAIAQKIYGAAGITADKKIREQIKELSKSYPSYPVCIAKTQMSFSTDPLLKGAPSGHYVDIKEVRVSAGAGFIVVLTVLYDLDIWKSLIYNEFEVSLLSLVHELFTAIPEGTSMSVYKILSGF